MDIQFILFPAINPIAQIFWLDRVGGGGITWAVAPDSAGDLGLVGVCFLFPIIPH